MRRARVNGLMRGRPGRAESKSGVNQPSWLKFTRVRRFKSSLAVPIAVTSELPNQLKVHYRFNPLTVASVHVSTNSRTHFRSGWRSVGLPDGLQSGGGGSRSTDAALPSQPIVLRPALTASTSTVQVDCTENGHPAGTEMFEGSSDKILEKALPARCESHASDAFRALRGARLRSIY
jgi:hypothetical protein